MYTYLTGTLGNILTNQKQPLKEPSQNRINWQLKMLTNIQLQHLLKMNSFNSLAYCLKEQPGLRTLMKGQYS